MPESMGDFETGDAGGIHPGKNLVGITGTDIEERVSALRSEYLGDDSFNGRVFADVTGREIGWNDGRGLSVRDRKNRL
jgi:hypothetical protein